MRESHYAQSFFDPTLRLVWLILFPKSAIYLHPAFDVQSDALHSTDKYFYLSLSEYRYSFRSFYNVRSFQQTFSCQRITFLHRVPFQYSVMIVLEALRSITFHPS